MSYFQVAENNEPISGSGRSSFLRTTEAGAGQFLGFLAEPSPDTAQYEKGLVSFLLPACIDKIIPKIKEIATPLEHCLTNIIFFRRHPDRRGTKLPRRDLATTAEKRLIPEWGSILDDIVRPSVSRYINGLVFDLNRQRKDTCRLVELTDLSNFLTFLGNPVEKQMDGSLVKANQSTIDQFRRAVQRVVNDLSIFAVAYAELRCGPPASLKAMEQQVEQLPWPKDLLMQDQRRSLLAALRKAQERLGTK
jgi:hypothetical protein